MEQVETVSKEPSILPEPNPYPMSEDANRRHSEFINTFPHYPDEGIFTSSGLSIFGEQSIHFRKSDVATDIDWARKAFANEPDFIKFLESLASHVKEEFPGNPDKWRDEFVGKNIDSQTTLDTVKKEKAASCFHRNLVYAYVLQQLGIEAKFVAGEWVETTRNKVVGQYPKGQDVPYDFTRPVTMGFQYLKGERGESHAFTILKKDGKHYFADAALWVKDSSGSSSYPVVKEVTEEELMGRDIMINLPNGTKRHYVFKRYELEITQPQSIAA